MSKFQPFDRVRVDVATSSEDQKFVNKSGRVVHTYYERATNEHVIMVQFDETRSTRRFPESSLTKI